ncbi:hypothetical protein [Ramlibacter montanisoli]|uniref:hypothetical protein n=1 Tax=Ramlibacter montanisoli TaxID=2732512 RepID=UPI00209BE047|nr:hypothetical protein [Ramlibacter montanisoli]
MTAADESLVVLRNAGGDAASVTLHGAQLLSWVPAGASEQIYRSPLSAPAAGKACAGACPSAFRSSPNAVRWPSMASRAPAAGSW